MSNFGETLKRLMDSTPKPVETIANEIGTSRTNLYNWASKKSVGIHIVEMVCRYFHVTPLLFFDPEFSLYGSPSDTHTEYNNTAVIGATMNIGLVSEIDNLKNMLAEKERFIQYLLKTIEKNDIKSIDDK